MYRARLACSAADVRVAQALRWLAFRGQRVEPGDSGLDADEHDRVCQHVLVEDIRSGAPVCTFRLLPIAGQDGLRRSYSARYYDLSALEGFRGPMLEMGRFCLHPARHDPDILRIAWGMLTRHVDQGRIEMLFGCTSFAGTDEGVYLDAFALLKERYTAPERWAPKGKATQRFRFAHALPNRRADRRLAMLEMPPLLRTYLAMGGWVSDHAVVDRDLQTLHVFTALEIGRIPPARARSLRMVAG
ncbi:MAG: GNAT family N-acyltransferase [Paracoccaceae bacterium]